MRARHAKGGNQRPTIIVRGLDPIEPAPHSGAWKVAYADFVTAMMAFFLLMWLINATTEAQRRGLANYFSPSNILSFHTSGTGEPFGGKSPFSTGGEVSDQGAVQAITGKAPPEPNAIPDRASRTPGSPSPRRVAGHDAHGVRSGQNRTTTSPEPAAKAVEASLSGPAGPDLGAPALAHPPPTAAAREQARLGTAAAAIRLAIAANPALARLSSHFSVDLTPRGLRIQILDGERRPMFALGSAVLAIPARHFLARLAPILARLPNPVMISGYTDAAPYRGAGMTNWELSTERANATRGLLVADGLPKNVIARVSGYADRHLLLPADPLAAANRRVAILVLRVAPRVETTGHSAPVLTPR